jgi:hypothetical protein
MVEAATQVAKLRQESERLTADQAAQGVVLVSDVRHAAAANKAKADLLQAISFAACRTRTHGRSRTGTPAGLPAIPYIQSH